MPENLISTCIGGLIAIIGALVGSLIQYHLTKKEKNFEQKKETYELMYKALTQLTTKADFGNFDTDITNASIKVHLYGSKKVIKEFEKIIIKSLPQEKKDIILTNIQEQNKNLDLLELESTVRSELKK